MEPWFIYESFGSTYKQKDSSSYLWGRRGVRGGRGRESPTGVGRPRGSVTDPVSGGVSRSYRRRRGTTRDERGRRLGWWTIPVQRATSRQTIVVVRVSWTPSFRDVRDPCRKFRKVRKNGGWVIRQDGYFGEDSDGYRKGDGPQTGTTEETEFKGRAGRNGPSVVVRRCFSRCSEGIHLPRRPHPRRVP